MQLTPTILLFGGVPFAAAIPQQISMRQVEERLWVRFWEAGCRDSGGPEPSSTVQIHPTQDGYGRPGECQLVPPEGWVSVEIIQPMDGETKYSVDFYSGEGCNNFIGTYSEEGVCYTQPEGEIFTTFIANLL